MGKTWLSPLLIFSLSLYLFTYNLGNQSLQPWDEGWYAAISRNIVRSKDFLRLTFNDQAYYDHPPLGFYFIAASFQLLGTDEFTARIPMALLGSLAVVAVFLTGQKLGGNGVGVAAALVLLSSRWFIIRSRTANLEAPLLLAQVLSFYFFLHPRSMWQIAAGWFSLSLALLTKSVISITLTPLALWSTATYFHRQGQTAKVILLSLACLILPLLPWYTANYLKHGPPFVTQSVFNVGARGGTTAGVTRATTERTLLYLRSAMHKWYLPLLASLAVSLILIRHWPTRWSLAYLLLSAFPYFLSSQTHVWHLLPILPPAALLISLVAHKLPLPSPLLLGGFLTVFAVSYSSYWPQFIDLPKATTFEAQVGLAASQNGLPIVSQENTYIPTLAWYADLPINVSPVEYDLENYPRPFQLITHTYLLNQKLSPRITHQFGDTVIAVVN